MSVNEVTYYEVECDVCHTKTGDHDEFSAWSDSSWAIDRWRDGEGIVTNDGRAFCDACIPPGMCRSSDDNKHVFEDGECIECGFDEPVVLPDEQTAGE
jgi:hypothetical protein